MFDIPFIAIGYIPNPSYWLGYFVTIAYTINCSINGWVYVFLNKTVQIEIRNMYHRGQRVNPTAQDEKPASLIRTQTMQKIEAFRLKSDSLM